MTQGRDTKVLYFAYGSNMFTRRLRAATRAPSAIVVGIGYVGKRRLTFDKVSEDGSGKCDAKYTRLNSDQTHGVIFKIAKSEKPKLAALGKGYCEKKVMVVTSAGNRKAFTYIAIKKKLDLCPYHWYKAFVIAGAVEHGLPQPYIEWLRTVRSKVDPKTKRRAKEEALLFGG